MNTAEKLKSRALEIRVSKDERASKELEEHVIAEANKAAERGEFALSIVIGSRWSRDNAEKASVALRQQGFKCEVQTKSKMSGIMEMPFYETVLSVSWI